MIMQNKYLDDVKEHIRHMPDEAFAQRGITRESVLANKETMHALWFAYQKDVEDYDCDADFALQDAVAEVLGRSLCTPKPMPRRRLSPPPDVLDQEYVFMDGKTYPVVRTDELTPEKEAAGYFWYE